MRNLQKQSKYNKCLNTRIHPRILNLGTFLLLFICIEGTAFRNYNTALDNPISSSDEERPRARNILSASIVFGPRPSCALKTAVSACAAIPYPLPQSPRTGPPPPARASCPSCVNP
uniref:Uncharacterized protein n=1 Tax=Opuntia streptacantha TaxID=393608 RepID=A0A7C9DUW6_OPUST